MAMKGSAGDSSSPTERKIRRILVKVAKQRESISYSKLASLIDTAGLVPHSARLSGFLTTLSEKESDAGRGLLSVIVVRKGTGLPGVGFFRRFIPEAKPKDFRKAWERELAKVHHSWRGH
jgi:hypothetical protein